MAFRLEFTILASKQFAEIQTANPKKHKKVLKCMGLLEHDPKYPGLNSHRYEEYDDVYGEKIWESYVENQTPGAYRVFWHYRPDKDEITVLAITPHP